MCLRYKFFEIIAADAKIRHIENNRKIELGTKKNYSKTGFVII